MGQAVPLYTFQAGALEWHLLGMGRSSRHSPCCSMPERCSQTQRATVVPVAMSSHLGPLHARAGNADLLGKHEGHFSKVRQPPPGNPTPTHPVLGALRATTRAELMVSCTSGTGLGASGAGANSLVDVKLLLPAPCPPGPASHQAEHLVLMSARAHTHTHAEAHRDRPVDPSNIWL